VLSFFIEVVEATIGLRSIVVLIFYADKSSPDVKYFDTSSVFACCFFGVVRRSNELHRSLLEARTFYFFREYGIDDFLF
jgi:hypothetical protein